LELKIFSLDYKNETFAHSCEYKSLENFSTDVLANSVHDLICIIHINIVSLHKIFEVLTNFLTRFLKAVDVICLSETRLNNRNLSHCKLPGYNLFYENSGGSAIYVSDNLKFIQLTEIKFKCHRCEDVWIKLKLINNETLIVGSVYRHPSNFFKQFENEFINIIKHLKLIKNI